MVYVLILSVYHNSGNFSQVTCNVLFGDEDGSNLTSSDPARIFVIKLTVNPKPYSFQRLNGKIDDTAAYFQNAAVYGSTLDYDLYWVSRYHYFVFVKSHELFLVKIEIWFAYFPMELEAHTSGFLYLW